MTMAQLYHIHVLGKAQSILFDDSHPMYHKFNLLPSGTRYITPISKTYRFRHSIYPLSCKVFTFNVKSFWEVNGFLFFILFLLFM